MSRQRRDDEPRRADGTRRAAGPRPAGEHRAEGPRPAGEHLAEGPRGHEAAPGAEGPRPGDQELSVDGRRAQGMRIRREVLGDAHVDRAAASTTPFTAPFQDFITRTAWGDVWARPGLDRRTRSCVTLGILVALRAEDEIAMHVRAALRNGLTGAEIGEVILHAAVYAGVPAANTAMRIASRVLEEEGVPEATTDAEQPPDRGRVR